MSGGSSWKQPCQMREREINSFENVNVPFYNNNKREKGFLYQVK